MTPGTYRPTTLNLASKRCARAITYYEAGVEERRQFETGIAVHAMIERGLRVAAKLGEPLDFAEFEELSLVVGEELIAVGRTFEGKPEPPLAPDAVWEGRDLALSYVAQHPLEPADRTEVGMAVDEKWRPAKYGDGARMRLIADLVGRFEEWDEERGVSVLLVRDYKSSWQAREGELETLQRKAQAVLAAIHYPDGWDVLRIEVVNLRLGMTYTREMWAASDAPETLERWRRELEATMQGLDRSRLDDSTYPATPGAGCVGCPYLMQCETGRTWTGKAYGDMSAEDAAVELLALEAVRGSLIARLKDEVGEDEIALPGGGSVGYHAAERRSPTANALREAWQEHEKRGGEIEGFLLSLNPGMTQLEAAAKTLFPARADAKDRKAWVAARTEVSTYNKFGVHGADEEE